MENNEKEYEETIRKAFAPGYVPGSEGGVATNSGLGIASMVIGIISLLILPFILGPLALIFGAVDMSNNANGKRGMAIAGVVMGIISTLFSIIVIASL